MRLALSAPERVHGLVIQNANAYMEGVSAAVAGLFMPLWKERNQQTLAAARGFLSADMTKMQYTAGAHDAAALNPDAWTLDQALLDRPGNADIQLALFSDYEKNVAAYDQWHAYLRQHQPRTLIVWGKNDPLFIAAGAEAYQRDLKDAELVLLDGGHFVLEEQAAAVADHIGRVFGTRSGKEAVQTFYRELGAGRLDQALSLLSKDVSWNDPPGFPYGGRLTGAAEVREKVFAGILADWAPFSINVHRLVVSADGRDVVAIGSYTGQNKRTGKGLDVPFVHVWNTAGGELTHFATHTDTATLRAAMTS
jgi:ketosteroid isomerase-like protein